MFNDIFQNNYREKPQVYSFLAFLCFLGISFLSASRLQAQGQTFQYLKDLSAGNTYYSIRQENDRGDLRGQRRHYYHDYIVRVLNIRSKQYSVIQRVSWWNSPNAPNGYSDSVYYSGTQTFFQRSDSTTVYELNIVDSTEKVLYTVDSARFTNFGFYPVKTYKTDSILGIQTTVLELYYVNSWAGACPNNYQHYAAPFGFVYNNTEVTQ